MNPMNLKTTMAAGLFENAALLLIIKEMIASVHNTVQEQTVNLRGRRCGMDSFFPFIFDFLLKIKMF